MKGADFGLRTAGKALRGVFSGNSDEIEAEIEADAREFEAQARKICEHLAPMLETQQQLVETLPAFKPYATMDQRSEEHTSDLQSLMRISYAVFSLKKKNHPNY